MWILNPCWLSNDFIDVISDCSELLIVQGIPSIFEFRNKSVVVYRRGVFMICGYSSAGKDIEIESVRKKIE